MDDLDVQHALLHKVIDLSLSLVDYLLHLRNILEPKPEYWIEFVEPFLREKEERKRTYWNDIDKSMDVKMSTMKQLIVVRYRRNLIVWNVKTSNNRWNGSSIINR